MRTTVFAITCILGFLAGAEARVMVCVAPFEGGRQAALSLTFDDGLYDQYTLAFPQLKSRGLKATFAVIGSKVGGVMHSSQDRIDGVDGTPCMTWDMLREMAADGQEIASHGWEHKRVTQLDSEALRREVERNDSAIMANIDVFCSHSNGKEKGFPLTYVYPGNNKSAEAVSFCEQGRVGSRLFQISVGSKRTRQWLYDYVDDLITRGEWGVTMTHGIARGYDHFNDPQILWDFFDYIGSKQDLIWVAPLHEVAGYVRERDNATVTITDEDADNIVLTVSITLDPTIFAYPLTLLVKTYADGATQDGKDLTVKYKNGQTIVSGVNPNGGAVTIHKKTDAPLTSHTCSAPRRTLP